MKKSLVSVMAVFFVMLFAHVALAQTAAIHSGAAEGAAFFDSNKDVPIGTYYDGTLVEVLHSQDEWSLISISDTLSSMEGYVRSKDLDTSMEAVTGYHEIQLGLVTSSIDTRVPYYAGPGDQADVLGYLPNQAKIRVFGKYAEYYHVAFANKTCFISANNLLLADAVLPDIYGGIPEIGYLYLDRQQVEPPVLKAYPAEDAMTIEHPWLSVQPKNSLSYPIELLADLGDWYQVRVMDEFGCGFMKKSCFSNKILLDDLFLSDTLALTSGAYQTGNDIKSGLYTFALKKDDSGLLTISSSQNAYDKSLQATGPSAYTLYIPLDASLRLEGDGTLTPMRQAPVLTEENGYQYTGNGMFYVASQFPKFNYNQTGVTYTFTVADQSSSGVVIRYDLLGNELERRILAPGEKYEANQIALYDSTFVEIQNCVLTIYYSHNG